MGEIPQLNVFAGNTLDMPLGRTRLYKCEDCNLYFRWPRLDKELRDRFYQHRSEAGNSDLKKRMDWRIAADRITKERAGGSILDIGCSGGMFLEGLKGHGELYGIEINPTAAREASAKGIKIVAQDFSEMKRLGMKFDTVTAFNVIEHVEYPLDFIASMAELAGENGCVILSSGDTESLMWKIGGRRCLYCANPEHLSFINESWCDLAAERSGLQIEHVERFSYGNKKGPARYILDISKSVAYLIAPNLFGRLRKLKKGHPDTGGAYSYPPSWTTGKDHLIAVFKKK